MRPRSISSRRRRPGITIEVPEGAGRRLLGPSLEQAALLRVLLGRPADAGRHVFHRLLFEGGLETTRVSSTTTSTRCCCRRVGELDEAKRKQLYHDMAVTVRDTGGLILPMFNDFIDAHSDKVNGLDSRSELRVLQPLRADPRVARRLGAAMTVEAAPSLAARRSVAGGAALVRMIAQRIALGILLLWAVSVLIFAGTAESCRRCRDRDARADGDAGGGRQHPQRTGPRSAGGRPLCRLACHAVRGDFGKSYTNRQDIAEKIGKRLGTRCFLPRQRRRSRCRSPSFSVYSRSATATRCSIASSRSRPFPRFPAGILAGYLLILLFAVKLRWFPSTATFRSSMSLASSCTRSRCRR